MKYSCEKYSIDFDDKNGSVSSLIHNKKEFIGAALPLFSVNLRQGKETKLIFSDFARVIRVNLENGVFTADYYDFPDLNISFSVRAVLRQRIEWSISFHNESDLLVEWMDFPRISVPNDISRESDGGKIVLDFNEGLLIEDIEMRQRTFPHREAGYPGVGTDAIFPAMVQSQFLAYYQGQNGLYFAAEDNARGIKGIDYLPINENQAVKLQMHIYPGVTAETAVYSLAYPLVWDFFDGDWHEAAGLYREWFEKQLPNGLLKIKDTERLPEWYFDSPLVVTYPICGIHDMDTPIPNKLYPYNNALPIIEKISKETKSRVMALLMQWESTAPWCPPYAWPPLGGEAELSDFANRLHEKNNLLGVYGSGISYTVKSNLCDYDKSEEYEKNKLYRYMCAAPEDSDIASYIVQCIRKSYDMCISQEFNKKLMLSEIKKMLSVKLDYIQILDQNHGGTPYACYSKKHGHVPCPGAWMVDEMKDFLARLTKLLGDDILIGCESAAAESYIPYLKLSDNRFNLNYHSGKPIPIYSYIYHEYLHNFSGNSVCSLDFIDINRSPDCYLMRMAYSFLAGDLMTLVINENGDIVWSWGERDFSVLPNRENALKLIKSATAYRRNYGKDFLLFGRMIKPCELECEKRKMYKVKFPDYYTEFPAVLSSAYVSADGRKAQYLVNYTTDDIECDIDLPINGRAFLVNENGEAEKELANGKNKLLMSAVSVAQIIIKE